MRRKTTKTGNSLAPSRRQLLGVFAASLPAFAFQQKGGAYSVVAGTVFQANGFSFPGVKVTLLPKSPTAGAKQNDSTSFRGEFSFRVPPVPGTYVITATKRGFATSSVEAVVPGEGRVDVTITLAAESKR